MLRECRRRWRRRQRTVSQESVPTTLVAPTRPKHRHENIPSARLHAKRGRIAIRTTVAFWEQIEKEDRRQHGAEHKESANDDDAEHGLQHGITLLQALLHFHPRLDIRDVVFDALDDDLGSGGEGSVIEAPSP